MILSLFHKRKFQAPAPAMRPATISDFGGGLNVVDNDLTMKTRFAVVLKNMRRGLDGAMSIRYGTKFRWDVAATVTGDIIEVVYFQDHLIAFTDTGQIAKITEEGTITKVWDDTIAGGLFGSPDGWSSGLTHIDTTTFKSSLVAQNGVDKPIIIDDDLTVDYLQDPATGSNVNTPIAKYCTTVTNFCVHGGVSGAPGEIYISATGAVGVYPGDDPPNDSISLNLAAYVPETDGRIIGLGSFRNTLLVFFEGAMVIVVLGGQDDDGNHVPDVQDTIIEHGVVSFRTMIGLKNDFIMADPLGAHSALKNQFGLTETKGISALIEPAWQATAPFEFPEREDSFAVYNHLGREALFFLKNDGETICWAMQFDPDKGVKNHSWARYEGLEFVAGCTSEKGRVFLTSGTRIYQYGNGVFPDEDYSADLLEDSTEGEWATATAYVVGDKVLEDGVVYICLASHTSGTFAADLEDGLWTEYLGVEIEFDWELPWTDIKQRVNTKELRFVQADTAGRARFTMDIFVDNFYKDQDGEYNPAVQLEFVAGDSGGYGSGDQPYGGGRRLKDERPYGMPARFKIMKIRIHGATREPLSIITISILYLVGAFNR